MKDFEIYEMYNSIMNDNEEGFKRYAEERFKLDLYNTVEKAKLAFSNIPKSQLVFARSYFEENKTNISKSLLETALKQKVFDTEISSCIIKRCNKLDINLTCTSIKYKKYLPSVINYEVSISDRLMKFGPIRRSEKESTMYYSIVGSGSLSFHTNTNADANEFNIQCYGSDIFLQCVKDSERPFYMKVCNEVLNSYLMN